MPKGVFSSSNAAMATCLAFRLVGHDGGIPVYYNAKDRVANGLDEFIHQLSDPDLAAVGWPTNPDPLSCCGPLNPNSPQVGDVQLVRASAGATATSMLVLMTTIRQQSCLSSTRSLAS